MLQGRNYVIPDDVKALAPVTLPHRIIMSPSARMKGINSQVVVEGLLNQIQVPGSKAGYR
jgi:MoxR-like ATPase